MASPELSLSVWAVITKYRTREVYKEQKFIAMAQEARSPRVGCWHGGWGPSQRVLCGEGAGSSLVSARGTNLVLESPLQAPSPPPPPPGPWGPANAIALGVRIQHRNVWGRDTDFQSVTWTFRAECTGEFSNDVHESCTAFLIRCPSGPWHPRVAFVHIQH